MEGYNRGQATAMHSLHKIRGIHSRFPGRYMSPREIALTLFYGIETSENTGWTLLHLSAFREMGDICFQLLTVSTYDLNRTTDFGETPLHLACVKANDRCIEAILHFKPEINTRNKRLYTPLNSFFARPPVNCEILKKLLDAGANPNIPDEDGFSPLHTLAIQPETDKTDIFARLLVQYKGNVNSKNKFQETPLHIAVYEGRRRLVEVLIDNGASMNIPDVDGRTSMDIALGDEYEYSTIYDFLAKHLITQYCCGDPVNLDHLKTVCNNETYRNFKKICEDEIQKLKMTFAGESTVTFHTILKSSTHTVAKYFFNSDIVMSFEKFNMKESVLQSISMRKYRVALERCNGMKLGIVAINEILPFLPEPCIDKLIEYLNNEDFSNLHKACFSQFQ